MKYGEIWRDVLDEEKVMLIGPTGDGPRTWHVLHLGFFRPGGEGEFRDLREMLDQPPAALRRTLNTDNWERVE